MVLRRNPLLYDEEDEQTFWERAGSAASPLLTGLAAVGHGIDKTFGGRAIRGALGGRPRELLSIIPGSDYFNLTDPGERVTGAQLNANVFGSNANPDILSGAGAGGIATEILLDPLTYLTFGGAALSKLGKVAAKAGVKVKGGAARAAGFAAGSDEAAKVAKYLSETPEAVSGLAGHYGRPVADVATDIAGKKLGGHVGLSALPFGFGPQATFNLPAGNALMGVPYLGAGLSAAGKVLGATGRGLAGTFGKATKGVYSAPGQEMSRAIYEGTPEAVLGGLTQRDEFLSTIPRDILENPDAMVKLRRELESVNESRIAGPGPPRPDMPKEFQPAVDWWRQFSGDTLAQSQRMGTGDQQLGDFLDYFARQIDPALTKKGKEPAELLGFTEKGGPFQVAEQLKRVEAFKGIPTAGKDSINQFFQDAIPANVATPAGMKDYSETVARQYRKLDVDEWRLLEKELSEYNKGVKTSVDAARADAKALLQRELGRDPTVKEVNAVLRKDPKYSTMPELAETGDAGTPWKKIPFTRQFPKKWEKIKHARTEFALAKNLAEYKVSKIGQLSSDYFPHHPVVDAHWKIIGDATRNFRNEKLHEGIARAAMTAQEAAAKGIDAVPLTGVLEKAGFTAQGEAIGYSLDAIQKVHGRALGGAGDLVVPAAFADDIGRMSRKFTAPVEVQKFVDNFWDPITKLTKTFQTVLFPAYHIRNQSTAAWQHFVHNMHDPSVGPLQMWTKPFTDAQMLRAGKGLDDIKQVPDFANLSNEQAMAGMHRELQSLAISRGQLEYHLAKDPKAMTELADILPGQAQPGFLDSFSPIREAGFTRKQGKAWAVQGVGGRTKDEFPWAASGRKLAGYLDNINEVAGYLAKRRQGFSPEAARLEVVKAHYDFAGQSLMDPVMRRLVPFWTWTRENVPAVIRELSQKPGGLMATAVKATAKARGDEPGFVPPWLGGGVALPVGSEKDGQQRYLSQLGLPFEDVGELAASPLRGTLGALNPLLKYPLEQLTGQQFFTGRDLRDLQSRTGAPQPLENLLMNSPAGRFITTGGTAADLRKWPLAAPLNLLTGVKLTDVDVEKARTNAGREYLQAQLRGMPHVRQTRPQFYVPESMRGEATPEELMLTQMLRNIGREQRR